MLYCSVCSDVKVMTIILLSPCQYLALHNLVSRTSATSSQSDCVTSGQCLPRFFVTTAFVCVSYLKLECCHCLAKRFAIRRIVTAMMLSHMEKSTIRVVLKLRCHSKLNECHCLTVELSLILFAVLRFSPLIISVPSYCLPQQIGRNMINK